MPILSTALRSLGVCWLLLAAIPALAQQGTYHVDKVPYRGWANALRLTNDTVELIVTLDVGPRVISYRLKDGKNVFKEYDGQMGKSGESTWQIRGGHRLWTAPEDLTRTYAPDNAPVTFSEPESGVVRLTPPADSAHGIQKELDLRLAPTGTKVALTHRIKNIGKIPTDLAIWALSVMAPGGVEVLPMPPSRPHPGDPRNARTPDDFAPDRALVLWPFFDFKDPRWSFGSRYITLRQSADRGPTKLGLDHREGWAGYLNGGTLFVKRFDRVIGAPYPDRGVNFETFTNQDMLEMESLGPTIRLGPGLVAEHLEEWELFGNVGEVRGEDDIDRAIVPKVRSK